MGKFIRVFRSFDSASFKELKNIQTIIDVELSLVKKLKCISIPHVGPGVPKLSQFSSLWLP